MNSPRYLIVVPNQDSRDRWRDQLTEIGRQPGFAFIEGDGFLLVCSTAPLLIGEGRPWKGVIVGNLYRRNARQAVKELAEDETKALLERRGEKLVEQYWGDYVAIVLRNGAPTIARAPFGDLPCYVYRFPDAALFGSDIALLRSVAIAPRVDWHAVTLHLIAPEIRRRQTCLTDIEELGCGECVTVGASLEYQTIWSPWSFACRDQRCDDTMIASQRLRVAILDSIAAQTADGSAIMLLLSGGVDSSIVAASLSAAGRDTTALTMVTRDAGGDERCYARAVADHCRMPLTDVVRDPAMVDLTRSDARDLPNPTETAFTQATRCALCATMGSSDSRVLHGGGGDQIFCSLQSAAPLADLIQSHWMDWRIPRLTLDLAELAHSTAAAVAWQAMSRLIKRRSTYRWPSNLDCLTPIARAREVDALSHLWLSPPPGIGSGRAGHVALTLSALGVVQSPAWRAHPPLKAILLSQPVIETCLTIPPWLWFERGRNRAIVRRAFEDLLPAGHAWRRGKGAMASFMIEIFEANRTLLRALIGDGALVREGLVDRDACLQILDMPPPVRGNAWSRLLQFADVEAWAASW